MKLGKLYIFFIGGILTAAASCGGRGMLPRIETVEVPTVYKWNGPVKEYPVKPEKKKVINYLSTLGNFEEMIRTSDPGKIDRIIRENPDFQFLFYIGKVVPADTVAFKEMMVKYRCAFPVMLDFEDDFYKANEFKLKGKKGGRKTIGYICDKDGYVYGVSVIGTRMSFFDEEFRKAKRKI